MWIIHLHFSPASIAHTCLAGGAYNGVYGPSGELLSDATCTGGMYQSPIDIPVAKIHEASVHAPIYYRNYFNGPKYNKVNKLLRYN